VIESGIRLIERVVNRLDVRIKSRDHRFDCAGLRERAAVSRRQCRFALRCVSVRVELELELRRLVVELVHQELEAP
jgi:hypothetical protein